MLLIITVVSLTTAFALLSKSLWGDEVFSINAAEKSYSALVKYIAADVHPPLYFILLKSFISFFNYSEISVRIFQGIIASAFFFVTLLLFRKILPDSKYHPSWILFILSSEAWLFLPMARYYALTAFLVVFSLYVFIHWLDAEEENKIYPLLLLLTYIAIFYTNYVASIVIMVQAAYILIYKRTLLKKILILSIVSFCTFIPWAIIVIKQSTSVHQGGVVKELNHMALKIAYCIYAFLAGETNYPFDIPVICAIIVLAYIALTRINFKGLLMEERASLTLISATIIAGIIFTSLITTFIVKYLSFIYTPSRTLFALPLFYLLIGLSINQIKGRHAKTVFIALILALNLYGNYNLLANRHFMNPVYASPWKEVLNRIEGQSGYVVTDDAIIYDYYIRQNDNKSYPRLIESPSLISIKEVMSAGPENLFIIKLGRENTPSDIPTEVSDYIKEQSELVEESKFLLLDERYKLFKEKVLRRSSYDAKMTLTKYKTR